MRTKIDCCYKCPDRVADPNCHGYCEKYKQQKAEYEATKAEMDKQAKIQNGLSGQSIDGVGKAPQELAPQVREVAVSMNPCDNCVYYGRYYSQGVRMCLYLFMTYQKRPCPPGAECTVKVERTVNRKRSKYG